MSVTFPLSPQLDALGGKRRVSINAGSSERQTLNQLLSCMDGFSKNENVIVIAATNSPDILDPALVRPGRFDSTVNVPMPDVRGRQEILDLYLSRVVAGPGLDSALLARATPGFSGAQLEALVNSAALMAAQRGADAVEPRDVEEARDKLIMGPSKKNRVQHAKMMKLTAYHEGGHTLAALKTRGASDLHKVTILPRGQSGGATYSLPRDEELNTRESILAQIDVAMGGRVAEEMIFGPPNVTTGAGSDMMQASSLARRYCSAYSMSELGLTSYADGTKPSHDAQAAIDREVERLLQESHARVAALLRENEVQLHRLADALLEYETLDASEVVSVIEGQQLTARRAATAAALARGGSASGGDAVRGKTARKAVSTSSGVVRPEATEGSAMPSTGLGWGSWFGTRRVSSGDTPEASSDGASSAGAHTKGVGGNVPPLQAAESGGISAGKGPEASDAGSSGSSLPTKGSRWV